VPPALELCGKRPAEPDGISDSRVHAIATGGGDLVDGVAGQPDPTAAERVGDRQPWCPGVGDENVQFEPASEPLLHELARVDRVGVRSDAQR